MFDGHQVSHVLDFAPPSIDVEVDERFRKNRNHMSISGAQTKQSLILVRNKLRLTEPSERGQYILKPIPANRLFARNADLPANEHLTMQIARQLFNIETAENALIFFKNGEPAYITRRFDTSADGRPLGQEDFASLLGHTRQRQGDEFKYMGSYESIALCMKQHVGAYKIDVERLFVLVVFNHLFHNADAHLKNFSLRETPDGDYRLSPAYDLLNTSLHLRSAFFFALDDGLYEGDTDHPSYRTLGFPAYDDFFELGIRIGMLDRRVKKILDTFCIVPPDLTAMIDRSFLSDEGKSIYLTAYRDRLKALNQSYLGRR